MVWISLNLYCTFSKLHQSQFCQILGTIVLLSFRGNFFILSDNLKLRSASYWLELVGAVWRWCCNAQDFPFRHMNILSPVISSMWRQKWRGNNANPIYYNQALREYRVKPERKLGTDSLCRKSTSIAGIYCSWFKSSCAYLLATSTTCTTTTNTKEYFFNAEKKKGYFPHQVSRVQCAMLMQSFLLSTLVPFNGPEDMNANQDYSVESLF